MSLEPRSGPTIWASSVGSEALARLGTASAGMVHSTYDEALNLELPTGVVSVVSFSKRRGPINVVLLSHPSHPSVFGSVRRGMDVSFEGGLLTIGDALHVLLSGAEQYHSPMKFRTWLGRDRIRGNLAGAEHQIIETGRPDGLGNLLQTLSVGARPKDAASPFVAAALPSVISLAQALSSGDVIGSVEAARGIIGLGVGLTPSGDDLLSGAFMALILSSKNGFEGPPHLREVTAKVALEAVNRTNLLSQNYIELASRGVGNEVVVRFIEELFTGSSEALARSLAELLDFGATSGTDIATGVIIGARVALGDKVGAS